MYYDRAKLICPSMESIDGKNWRKRPYFHLHHMWRQSNHIL